MSRTSADHRPRPSRSRPLGALMLALVCLGMPGAALADSAKLGQFWLDAITAQRAEAGRFIYLTQSGDEADRPLSALRGLKIDAYPGTAEAEAALEAEDTAAAVEAYDNVLRQRPPQWLRHWVIAAGRPVDAVRRYLTLVEEQAETLYLEAAPLRSLAGATDAQKNELRPRIERTFDNAANETARDLLAQMIELARVEDQSAPPVAADDDDDAAPAGQPDAGNGAPRVIPQPPVDATELSLVVPAGESQIVLTSAMNDEMRAEDPITRLLKTGRFAEARDEAARELQIVGQRNIAMRLYQHGMAVLGLAEQAGGDQELYLTAAVSFMRAAVYFDRSTLWKVPSLVEVGYVHMKIDRPDVAHSMFEKIKNEIDETDTALYERYQRLVSENAPRWNAWNQQR
mgnify:CR=1 FL=1